MTVVQASIRRLFEQVCVLEAEAAARPPRRRPRDRVLVVMAAAVIGAACAGTQQAAVRHVHLHALRAVAHLIDAPAERARLLPSATPRHRRAATHGRAHVEPPASVRVVAAAPAIVARPAAAPTPVAVHVAPRVAAPVATPVVAPAAPPAARPHATPAPVGIGPVLVASDDEPAPVADATPVPAP